MPLGNGNQSINEVVQLIVCIGVVFFYSNRFNTSSHKRCMCNTMAAVLPQGANSIVGISFLVKRQALFINAKDAGIDGWVMLMVSLP